MRFSPQSQPSTGAKLTSVPQEPGTRPAGGLWWWASMNGTALYDDADAGARLLGHAGRDRGHRRRARRAASAAARRELAPRRTVRRRSWRAVAAPVEATTAARW